MEKPFQERRFETEQNLQYIAQHAIEGDYAHLFRQGNDPTSPISITVATAGTAVTQTITFSRPYAGTPRVFVGVIGAQNDNTWVDARAKNVTKTGFTLVVNSGVAQTVTVNWEAVGQSGG